MTQNSKGTETRMCVDIRFAQFAVGDKADVAIGSASSLLLTKAEFTGLP
jgi:hypothetical protein